LKVLCALKTMKGDNERPIMCWSMWISSNPINTWNLKFKINTTNVSVLGIEYTWISGKEFWYGGGRWTLWHKNHIYRVMKMNNIWKIMQSTQYWYWWVTNLWIIIVEMRDLASRDLNIIFTSFNWISWSICLVMKGIHTIIKFGGITIKIIGTINICIATISR